MKEQAMPQTGVDNSAHAEHLKARMRDYFHRAYNLGDVSVIDELIDPNVVSHGMGPLPVRGRAAFKEWYTTFRSSFSSITCKTTHCVAEGNWVTSRIEFTGTHSGPGLGPPASGKTVTLTTLILVRFENGMAVEGFNEFDRLELMKAIGGI
jgi:predicted ester cyclase